MYLNLFIHIYYVYCIISEFKKHEKSIMLAQYLCIKLQRSKFSAEPMTIVCGVFLTLAQSLSSPRSL